MAAIVQLCSSELQHIEGLSCFRKILTLQGFDVGRVDLSLHLRILSSTLLHKKVGDPYLLLVLTLCRQRKSMECMPFPPFRFHVDNVWMVQ